MKAIATDAVDGDVELMERDEKDECRERLEWWW